MEYTLSFFNKSKICNSKQIVNAGNFVDAIKIYGIQNLQYFEIIEVFVIVDCDIAVTDMNLNTKYYKLNNIKLGDNILNRLQNKIIIGSNKKGNDISAISEKIIFGNYKGSIELVLVSEDKGSAKKIIEYIFNYL